MASRRFISHFSKSGLVLTVLGLLSVGVTSAAIYTRSDPAPDIALDMVRFDGPGSQPLWVQRHEVTLTQWNECNDAGACSLRLRPPPGGADREWPATGLSYPDVSEFVAWINKNSRRSYRLPTFAEWMSVAGPVLPKQADPIFTDPTLSWASTYLTENLVDRDLRPTGAWAETVVGIGDLNGNVWEWTGDCYRSTKGNDDPDSCPAFYVAGEHEAVIPYLVRDPAQGGCAVGAPPAHLGMRLVSDDA